MISLMDFAGLPPEINSARMYAGPGATSLVTAAGTWQALAAELGTAASSYRAVVAELTGGPWLGPSSGAMAAAVAPYVLWLTTTAARAQQTASLLGSAVAAYEAAFAATVPPPAIEVNRALLASLVATNVLGQNAPAIAAAGQYADMWAQDAAAICTAMPARQRRQPGSRRSPRPSRTRNRPGPPLSPPRSARQPPQGPAPAPSRRFRACPTASRDRQHLLAADTRGAQVRQLRRAADVGGHHQPWHPVHGLQPGPTPTATPRTLTRFRGARDRSGSHSGPAMPAVRNQ